MKIKMLKIRLAEKYFVQDEKIINAFLEQHDILKIETQLIQGEEDYWSVMLIYEETVSQVNEQRPKSTKFVLEHESDLDSDDAKLLDLLREWRNVKAKRQNLPNYFIATNKELMSIAKFRPARKEELIEIKGFGKHKIENYGEEIMEVLTHI